MSVDDFNANPAEDNTRHSSIGMTQIEAGKKITKEIVRKNLYGDHISVSGKPTKFKVGDRVRLSKDKRVVFDKYYTPNWIEEIFVVGAAAYTNPITYALKDLMLSLNGLL